MRQISPPIQYLQPLERSLSGDMGIAVEGSNASVPGDDRFHGNSDQSLTLLPMDPYSPRRWFEIFAQGTNSFDFEISAEPFVLLTQSHGSVSPTSNFSDYRVYVFINWGQVPTTSGVARINITSSTDYGTQYSAPYILLPYNISIYPSSFTSGFVESDGTISMEAEHFTRMTRSTSSLSYFIIPNYGKTLSGVTLTNRTASSLTPASAPCLEYDFYTFTDRKATTVAFILGQSLNNDPKHPLRYAISLDEAQPEIVQYVVEKPKDANLQGWPHGMPYGWDKAVVDAAWVSKKSLTIVPGKHTLKFWALEPGVILTKIVIDLGGLKDSYLGPPESFRIFG